MNRGAVILAGGAVALAAVCGVAGLAFGAWMDLYQLTLAARQDLDTYLALSASSLPYNLAHAIGNVVFCLLIGPIFIRALRRYRFHSVQMTYPSPGRTSRGGGTAWTDSRWERSQCKPGVEPDCRRRLAPASGRPYNGRAVSSGE